MLRRALVLLGVLGLGAYEFGRDGARAADVTFEARDYQTNIDTKITRASGGVKVLVDDQVIEAERMLLDGAKGRLQVEGEVVYTREDLTVRSESADFNLSTGLGTFHRGVLRLGTYLYLEGLEIEAAGPELYKAKHGKLTSCKDCPQSWSVTGVDIEMTVEGYAEIHHALVQIKDMPVFYAPLFIFPVKTRRQSGFLIPQYSSYADLGSEFFIPYFWAINEASDATLSPHYLTRGGPKFSGEYRYRYSNRSWIDLRGSFLHNDGRVSGVPDARYGYFIAERFQIAPDITQRFTGELASDGPYTVTFEREFPSAGFPSLTNDLSLTWQGAHHFTISQFRLNKGNLPRDFRSTIDAGLLDPDAAMGQGPIHALPSLGAHWTAYPVGGPFLLSAEARVLSLHRRGLAIDPDTLWIRTGNRGTLGARIEAPMTLGEVVQYQPAAAVRSDVYVFGSDVTNKVPGASQGAARARFLLEQRFSLSFDRVFNFESGELRALRHSIEPFVRWSYSPPDARSDHPFFVQVGAPRFDLFDPTDESIPTPFSTVSEEVRLKKHHLVTYGVGTRFVGRFGETNRSYSQFFAAAIQQDIDLLLGNMGRILITGAGGYAGYSISSEIAYDPRLGSFQLRNGLSYGNPAFSVGVSQTLTGQGEAMSVKQYGLGGSLNWLRPWYTTGSITYDTLSGSINEWKALVGFDGGASKCFYASVSFERPAGYRDMNWFPRIGIVINEATQNTVF